MHEQIRFDTKCITFLYDANGNKLRKTVSNGTSQDYLGGIEYSGGVIDAIYHEEGRATLQGSNWQYEYYLKDHLGNTRVIFTEDGPDADSEPDILQEADYYPFGMRHASSTTATNHYLYNGKELNTDLGLDWYDYGARWLDVETGRWSAIDPLAESYASMSPFNYVANNPIRNIDPDGRDIYVFNSDGIFSGEVIQQSGEDTGLIKNYKNNGYDIPFKFADPEHYPDLIVTPERMREIGLPFAEGGTLIDRVELIGKFDIQNELIDAGVFGTNPGALINLWTKSRGFDAPLDFSAKASLLDRQSTLFLIEDTSGDYIGHDFRNYGNFLWGATTRVWRIPGFVARTGAHVDVIWNEFELDTPDDQYSIRLGRQYAKQMKWKRLSF